MEGEQIVFECAEFTLSEEDMKKIVNKNIIQIIQNDNNVTFKFNDSSTLTLTSSKIEHSYGVSIDKIIENKSEITDIILQSDGYLKEVPFGDYGGSKIVRTKLGELMEDIEFTM